jgi:zinc/manganese transport system ATP-binding protein
VFIARALIHDPQILVMDEPFSAVDPAGKVGLAELVGEISAKRLVIVTSHDPMLLAAYTKEIVLVNRGIVAHGPPDKVLRPDVLEKVYGGAIILVREHPHIFDEHGHGARRR